MKRKHILRMKKINKFINYIFLAVILFYATLFVIDIISILRDPEAYRVPHDFTEINLTWKSPEVVRYIGGELIIVALLGVLFLVGYKKLKDKKDNKVLKLAYYCILISFLLVLIAGYFYWNIKT
jgi:hypothetical protein